MDEDLITYDELCVEIGGRPIDRKTLWRWERDGRFPSRIEVAPQSIRWKRGEIRAWKAALPRRHRSIEAHAA